MPFCANCGSEVFAGSAGCARCGARLVQPQNSSKSGGDAALRWVLPVGRSGLAIAAGYVGLCSLFLIPAQLALLLGILAVMDIKKQPEKHGLGRAWFAIVMGVVFTIVLIAVVALK